MKNLEVLQPKTMLIIISCIPVYYNLTFRKSVHNKRVKSQTKSKVFVYVTVYAKRRDKSAKNFSRFYGFRTCSSVPSFAANLVTIGRRIT